MFITCLSILAVDFKVFPRRFAKTETFGVSLMDIGVGIFIVSSALTSDYARNVSKSSEVSISIKFLNILTKSGWRNVVVLTLGIGRMIVVKLLKYHEKSSEYGLQWNFFVTLSLVWILKDLVHSCLKKQTHLILFALTVLSSYQFCLCFTQLPNFIFAAPRTNFLSSNREGKSLLSYRYVMTWFDVTRCGCRHILIVRVYPHVSPCGDFLLSEFLQSND